jgi:hypothetical protein
LRALAHDSHTHNSHLTPCYIPGSTNALADLLSCSFHLSDDTVWDMAQQLAPIQPPWWLVIPLVSTASNMNLALLSKLPGVASRPNEPMEMTLPGLPGQISVCPLTRTHGYNTSMTPCPSNQIFAVRYQVAQLAPSGSPVKSRMVEAALQAVGQTFTSLGHPDPCLQQSEWLNFRLQCQLQQ